MKERFVIELIFEKIVKCQNCCSQCSCKKLAKYISELGMDAFYQKYVSNELPEEIAQTLEKKIQAIGL